MRWREAQKRDSLSKIARELSGDASPYPKIFEANRGSIHDPNLVRVVPKIRIP